SSRRRHTRWPRDWSSDVCSSDLAFLIPAFLGAVTFDYGNNIRAQAKKAGIKNAFDIPGFVLEYIRPLFCEGRGPFRWVALSGVRSEERRVGKECRCRWAW